MRRLAEKMKAMVQEYIASTRHRMEFNCLKLPISRVLIRVMSIPDAMLRPINDTIE